MHPKTPATIPSKPHECKQKQAYSPACHLSNQIQRLSWMVCRVSNNFVAACWQASPQASWTTSTELGQDDNPDLEMKSNGLRLPQ